jgi:hypothetical protein
VLAALLCSHPLQSYAATSEEVLQSYAATRFGRNSPPFAIQSRHLGEGGLRLHPIQIPPAISDESRHSGQSKETLRVVDWTSAAT